MADKTEVSQQSILTDQFFYFFFRLRKNRVRKVVDAVNEAFPDETPQQKARRLIEAQIPLSFLGGTLMHLPALIPGVGQALQFLGLVGGASVITRMHLYLVLEIALLHGKDIDDAARVPEMAAVVAATGLAAGVPLLTQVLDVNPLYSLPAAGLTASGVSKLIGESAIRFYSGAKLELSASPLSTPQPVPAQ
ncbi:hypothetical protein [Desulforhabdus amnigena]|jgi:hypothetical protein|uniref:Uncharacterized protein n=1 Tax=Desulforhabdus amnigena TaxID=40218 RepID=A0A9W6FSK0_9BACT|nr:hypothetical protein [Desulforhabdus amnigena]NLJ27327.1 hypothetical protein [Deltaproteobacteria bacterium]GLI34682.1 hypothetical protein DAMNIGENAA_21150 [Desulforhabdus amnigena]